jgi:hypothetical protein
MAGNHSPLGDIAMSGPALAQPFLGFDIIFDVCDNQSPDIDRGRQ